jgi:glycosyltransferase involved in cell wall biosynthesis
MKLDLDRIWQDYVGPLGLLDTRPDFRFDPHYYRDRNPGMAGKMQWLLARPLGPLARGRKIGRGGVRPGNLYQEILRQRPRINQVLQSILVDSDLARAAAGDEPEAYELLFELMCLPPNFDEQLSHFSKEHYLRQYPDIADAGVHPLRHFLEFGKREKRSSLMSIRRNFYEGEKLFDPDKKTIIFMIHQLSRTGAPMVGLELIRQASHSCNVIALSLQDGPLLEQYRRECMAIFVSAQPHQEMDYVLSDHLDKVSFALLNSADTSLFIPALVARSIPFATYIHEYPQYSVPLHKTIWPTFYADALIYSSENVRDAWRPMHEDLGFDTDADTTIIAQATVCPGKVTKKQYQRARDRLSSVLGVDCSTRKIVYGVGSVHWRKGTDLFVLAAQMMHKRDPGALFVWVGDGLNSEDFHSGVWMEKHMAEVGANRPESFFHFLPVGDHYWDLCVAADVMFLSSRMDPLPSVVMDAVEVDCDVVLFEGASGYDDDTYEALPRIHKTGYGMLDEVVEVISGLGGKIGRIDPDEPKRKISRTTTLDPELFDKLATFIEGHLAKQRYFCLGQGDYDLPILFTERPEDKADRAREMQKAWSLGRRTVWKSEAEAHETLAASSNPVHHNSSIVPYEDRSATDLPDFSMHIHAYYTDDLEHDLQAYLAFKRARTVIITTDTVRKSNAINQIIKTVGIDAEIRHVPNQGRDILPFLQLFEADRQTGGSDIWCHVHQKKSLSSTPGGDVWRNFLLKILLGGADRVSGALFQMADPDTGLVSPFDPFICGWFASKKLLPVFQSRIKTTLPDHPILFPVGNMFWTRRAVIEQMNSYFGQNYPWPNEPIANDGTVYHLIERLWPTASYEAGLGSVFVSKRDQPRR